MSRHLIISSISQLTFADLDAFLRSIDRSETKAEIVFFTGECDDTSLSRIQRRGIATPRIREVLVKLPFVTRKLSLYKWAYPIMRLYRSIWLRISAFRGSSSLRSKDEFGKLFYKHNSMRFYYFRDFLRDHIDEFDRVVLCDVRDVVFQRDPFALVWQSGKLHCFLEERSTTIAKDKWNRYWTEKIGGAELLALIGDNPISCAGVTFGEAPVMLDYLERMCSHLNDRLDKFDLDQGIHNMMIWSGELPNVVLGECDASAVATIGLMPETSLICNDDGEILDRHGEVVPILHQYDRKPALKARVLARLGL